MAHTWEAVAVQEDRSAVIAVAVIAEEAVEASAVADKQNTIRIS